MHLLVSTLSFITENKVFFQSCFCKALLHTVTIVSFSFFYWVVFFSNAHKFIKVIWANKKRSAFKKCNFWCQKWFILFFKRNFYEELVYDSNVS